jgi:hypothetical protein
MTLYANKLMVGIGEIGRLNFFEETNGVDKLVVSLAIPIPFLSVIQQTIEQTLEKYQENMSRMEETKKGMN